MQKKIKKNRIIIIGNNSFIQKNFNTLYKKKLNLINIKFTDIKEFEFLNNDVVINCSQNKNFFTKKYEIKKDRNYKIDYILKNKNINLIILSSRTVYKPGLQIRENSKIKPQSIYGVNCLLSETNCKRLISKLTILRISNVVGVEIGKKKRKSLMSIMIKGIIKKHIRFDMNYYFYKDLIPINLLCEYIKKIISVKFYGTLNVGSGFKIKVKNFINYLSLDEKIKISIIKKKLKRNDFCYNISKLKNITKINFEKKKIINQYRKLGKSLRQIA